MRKRRGMNVEIVCDVRKIQRDHFCHNPSCQNTSENKPNDDFKKCTSCKLVWFCSKACQKEDWTSSKGHKKMCLKIKKVQAKIDELESNHQDLKVIPHEISMADVDKLLTEKSISSRAKYDLVEDEDTYKYHYIQKYEQSPYRKAYIEAKLYYLRILWNMAENYYSLGLYFLYFKAAKDVVKIAPFCLTDLIYYILMSLIHTGCDGEANQLINIWSGYFTQEKRESIPANLNAMLDFEFDKFNFEEDMGDFEVEDYVPLSPAILALRLQRIIRLDMFIEKIKQYDDFQEAIELDDGLLQQWSKSYPHILDKIGSHLLGGETKRLPNLRKECSDLSETYEQAEEILDEINELNNSCQIDFKFMFYFAVPKPGQTLEMDEERFNRILTSFDDSVHMSAMRWTRIYWNFFKRLAENYPKFQDLFKKHVEVDGDQLREWIAENAVFSWTNPNSSS